jgi:hypothetical protein
MWCYNKSYHHIFGSILEKLSTIDRLRWKQEPEVQGLGDWLWWWKIAEASQWRSPPGKIEGDTTGDGGFGLTSHHFCNIPLLRALSELIL